MIRHWIIAANQLATMKTAKGACRHSQLQRWQTERDSPPRCMSKPHNAQDIEDANITLIGLKRLRMDNSDLAQWGVNYYIHHNIASRSHLRMISDESAKKFSAFIQCLGFPKSRISCLLKPQTKTGATSVNAQIHYWRTLLSINADQIKLKTALEKRGADYGSLSMMLSFRLDKDETQASYGFRYAIYMMGILMQASEIEYSLS